MVMVSSKKKKGGCCLVAQWVGLYSSHYGAQGLRLGVGEVSFINTNSSLISTSVSQSSSWTHRPASVFAFNRDMSEWLCELN